ncbi:hypothetical protein CK501_15110 [Halovibrio salipaludis]|uniref:DUF2946 domain-containing protein n=2 Tax=Halovibrio salipaludis TaxID=2032626 RepID=A0A2A2EXF0_9GAMM|nr:hypothetical protein CK501_15110 [Halovibrio salipaludis]
MHSNKSWFSIFLIIALVLSPVVAGAGTMGGLMMGTMHSDQKMDCEGADAELRNLSPEQRACADGDGARGCCVSCVACALSLAFPLDLEAVSRPIAGHTFSPPRTDLESELQPPRAHSS